MRMRWAMGVGLLVWSLAAPCLGVVRYVNGSLATGANTGGSWANAYRGPTALRNALAAAAAGDEVWVARGTYVPSQTASGDTRVATFDLRNDVRIYGGFAGTETLRSERDVAANPTILSGDLAGNDSGSLNLQDNAYHVLSAVTPVTIAPVLDGFVVTAGNASGSSTLSQDRGGGLIVQGGGPVRVINCRFVNNRCTFGGGAVYMLSVQGQGGYFERCTFEDNLGGNFGGAFDTNASRTTFVSCVFRNNFAGRAGAVEVFAATGNSSMFNCLFIGNTAGGSGGGGAVGIYNGASVSMLNCTLMGNRALAARSGGTTATANLSFRGSIAWGNTGNSGGISDQQVDQFGLASLPVIQSSCIQGVASGGGNISADPLLLPTGELRWGSPCIDAANGLLLAGDFLVDVLGRPREVDDPAKANTGIARPGFGVPDMGAFEFQRSSCVADVGNGSGGRPDGGVAIEDLLDYLSSFEAGTLPADVAGGTVPSAEGSPDGGVTIEDLLYYLERFGVGC